MENEIWKDVELLSSSYQISNLGRFKKRTIKNEVLIKEKISILNPDHHGYYRVSIKVNGVMKRFHLHQLVAVAFLGHKIDGYKSVIDHINFDRTDNRVSNLRIVSCRENVSHRSNKSLSTSKYVGVCFIKERGKFLASIRINKKTKFLGYYENEYDAHLAYQETVNKLKYSH